MEKITDFQKEVAILSKHTRRSPWPLAFRTLHNPRNCHPVKTHIATAHLQPRWRERRINVDGWKVLHWGSAPPTKRGTDRQRLAATLPSRLKLGR